MHPARLVGLAGIPVFLAAGSLTAQTVATRHPHAARRAAAVERLGSHLLVVPSHGNFKSDDQAGYHQASDFQYLTGLSQVVGVVLVLDGRARTATLFVPEPNPNITWPMPEPGPATATRIGVDAVLPIDALASWLTERTGRVTGVAVAPTDYRGTVRGPLPMADTITRWTNYLRSLGFTGDIGPALPFLGPLREIKDRGEIAIFDRVGVTSGQAMLAGMRALKPGRSQRQVEVEVISACVEAGGRHSFWPWTMSGPRAVWADLYNTFVDYEGYNRVMQAGELVRIDVGCQVEHYMGDVGRTAPVTGRFDAGQREAWDLFIAGYRAGLATVADGVRATDVYRTALDRIRQLAPSMKTDLGKRAATVLLGPGGTAPWQFHGVGLDDAEGAPEVLRTGMVLAYELMFSVDDQGFYLEDMLLVEPGGHRVLQPGLPYTAAEIEATMRRR